LIGAAETRRRILSLWRPGASVRQREGELFVTTLAPSRVRVMEALGTPLVEQHDVLAAMPLDADEAAELAIPGSVAVARDGVVEVVRLDDMRDVDLSTWIEL